MPRTSQPRSATILACALWVVSGWYGAQFMYRGWVPHDEGTIAQSAERVLSGQVPHRDFDEVYTGGLTYLHAAGMKLLGTSLRAPRLVLFGFFMAFLAAAYSIVRRVSSPAAALVAMALAVVWSLPNYFVSLPSWYNLFFATFGVLALLRFLDTSRRRWIAIAGLCGGLSVLAKIVGASYLAGGLLFLMYLEQTDTPAKASDPPGGSRFWLIAAVPAVLLIAGLSVVLASTPGGLELFQLFVPVLAISLFLVWNEWRQGSGGVAFRVRRLSALTWPFIAGALVPVALFLLIYWRHGGVADLLRGVFILPQRRLAEASMTPPAMVTLGLAIPYAMLLLARRPQPLKGEAVIAAVTAVGLAAALFFGYRPAAYRAIWASARSLPLLAVVAGIRLVAPSARAMLPAERRQQVFLLVTMAAVVSLVQFPYATPTYFCYAAPMTVLALAGVISAQPYAPVRLHLSVAAFFLVFAMVFVNQSYGWNLGVRFLPYHPDGQLPLPRGGLRVPAEDQRMYGEIVRLAQAHAQGATIYAGPDCPEVYFLSGFQNPTRAVFDFLTPVREDAAWMTDLLARSPIHAAVINAAPLFSPRLDAGAEAVLQRRFPRSATVGHFVVRFE